jgi:hypothetical protein
MTMQHTYDSLASSTDETLEQALVDGTQPDLETIAGHEYRGWNTPFFAATAGILRFKKGFFKDPSAGGAVRGYNKDIVAGGGLMDPWTEKGKDGKAKPFGFYEIVPQTSGPYPNSVLLNYDCPRNFPLDPTKLLRDYVVQVNPDNPHLLLGKAYLALPGKWPTVSYFILERVGEAEVPVA